MGLSLTEALAKLETEYEVLDTMTTNIVDIHIANTMKLWAKNREAVQAESPKIATSSDQKQQACPSHLTHQIA